MPDFELRWEDPFSMCETVKLYQRDNSDYDSILYKSNYSNFSDDERQVNSWIKSGRGYRWWCSFLATITVTTDYESWSHIQRPDSNQI